MGVLIGEDSRTLATWPDRFAMPSRGSQLTIAGLRGTALVRRHHGVIGGLIPRAAGPGHRRGVTRYVDTVVFGPWSCVGSRWGGEYDFYVSGHISRKLWRCDVAVTRGAAGAARRGPTRSRAHPARLQPLTGEVQLSFAECRPPARRCLDEPGDRSMKCQKARQGRLVTLVVMGVLLSGCAMQGHPEAADTTPPATGTTGAAVPLVPEMLIGSWTLVDVADTGVGKILRLADSELHLIGSHCGTLGGSWRANDEGVFLADVWSASTVVVGSTPGCEKASQGTPGWLRSVTAYQFDGAGLPVLLDGRGQAVARLIPGATPTPSPTRSTPCWSRRWSPTKRDEPWHQPSHYRRRSFPPISASR